MEAGLTRLAAQCPGLSSDARFQSVSQLSDSSTHEDICVALSRFLELAPSMLSAVLQYLSGAPPPFECLSRDKVDASVLLAVLRATYRFLRLEPAVFRDLWDRTPILKLVAPNCSYSVDIRWCAIQILAIFLRMSDAAVRDAYVLVNISKAEAFSCLARWEEFLQDTAIEKAVMFADHKSFTETSDQIITKDAAPTVKLMKQLGGKISHVLICGIELPFRGQYTARDGSYVITHSVKDHLEAIALALSQKHPLLLEGPVGSGKTCLIREVARLTGNSVLFIHLDDQVDTKSLMGNYVCTEVPGEFVWQPGTLSQALVKGLWVVFEDIDKAPSEIFSALVSLLEDRKLQIPGRGEVVYAAEEFRLFATVSRANCASTLDAAEGRGSFMYMWRKVFIDAPTEEELAVIVKERFPRLAEHCSTILGTFNTMRDVSGKVRLSRQVSTRDLLKFCKRVASLTGHSNPGFLLDTVRGHIFLEAVDCFAGSISNPSDAQQVMRAVAECWNVPFTDIRHFPVRAIPQKHTPAKYISVFAETEHSKRLIGMLARCVELQEPVLLVGETGTGKTTVVQRLARQQSATLTVLNMSQQSDASDVLGGFKPVQAQSFCLSLLEAFGKLFKATFSLQENADYWETLNRLVEKKKWKQLLKAFRNSTRVVLGYQKGAERAAKRQKSISEALRSGWRAFSSELSRAQKQVDALENALVFSFVEGALVKALKTGGWVLLDEINLAPAEILERLNGVFDGESGTICLTERGDLGSIERHPDFRIFACMNPATDVGKHDLPVVLRNKFTEFYVEEMNTREDLEMLVKTYLDRLVPINQESGKFVGSEVGPPDIVDFYKQARQEADKRLLDSAGQKPQYSLRSLSRALEFTAVALRTYGLRRALLDGVCMFFLTLLDEPSSLIMEQLIVVVLFKKVWTDFKSFTDSIMTAAPIRSCPAMLQEFESEQDFIVTPSVREHLRNLARAAFIKKYPVLLQGPTSSGKTSLVEYLAKKTGHRFVRINNHEHTDLQEYLGCYVADESGKLVFKEGLLVEAVRNGHWVVLDELNLAPSEVLEALNRLLDDNRELFVPELQEMIKPHPEFMLFATQNPPGVYGGRKVLSRAFRGRFIELHVDDIPAAELCDILEKRCKLPQSHAKKMVKVMRDLQLRRQGSNAFAGKHGFITPRDLFRWGKRQHESGISYDDLARFGYLLLAERVRTDKERSVVQAALESSIAKIEPGKFYEKELIQQRTMESDSRILRLIERANQTDGIVWTKSMRRLFYLAAECYVHNEPLLLVGETGCGKTTVCQLLAHAAGKRLHIINCHQHTETSDFLGGFRPVRRDSIALEYQNEVSSLRCFGDLAPLSTNIEDSDLTMSRIAEQKGIKDKDLIVKKLRQLRKQWDSLFMWHDGPLISAMRVGDLVLVDEISLAEDSVLERLNSVLEPKKSMVLAENGGSDEKEIIAHPEFRLFATMNPGGDFGKKELSPALRNRFSEVWVPPIHDLEDLKNIITARLSSPTLQCLVDPLLHFWEWFQQRQELAKFLSVRDILSWTDYIQKAAPEVGKYSAFVHGAFLVLLDGLGLGSGISSKEAAALKTSCAQILLSLIPEEGKAEAFEACSLDTKVRADKMTLPSDKFGVFPFYIAQGNQAIGSPQFEFSAPTTGRNVMRLLRAIQLSKPVLLEGSPGVGKTSLVSALAAASGHAIVRINLSEQTDVLDLFGSDLPVEGGKAGEFQWSDGIFLQALKSGSWVLLDELNLASQSVLEGLNSCLDHRREVFIPELGQVFKCPSSFRIFACQNPLHEGGGRKGLPRSFMNRFCKVFVEPLCSEDYAFITRTLYPAIPEALLHSMVQFNSELHSEIMIKRSFGHSGSPWELNLRDILRWCSLVQGSQGSLKCQKELLAHFVNLVYVQRLRTQHDRSAAAVIFSRVSGIPAPVLSYPQLAISENCFVVGLAKLDRRSHDRARKDTSKKLQLLPGTGHILESVMHCVKNGWMTMLVGPSKSGKTSVVRLLAELTGNTLHEYALSRATDTSDLLGCYEQQDISRYWREAVAAVNYSAEALCSFLLSEVTFKVPVELRLESVKNILSCWLVFKQCQDSRGQDSSFPINELSELVNQISICSLGANVDFGLAKVQKLLRGLQNASSKSAGRFEWIDGDLLRAVEHGDWVLLENANLCNPTVLDRLNPLLEPGGKILINERGLLNGQPMLVEAHPDFRLFLTVDPSNGEVSRAMRNRGVEIYMMQPEHTQDSIHEVAAAYQDARTLIRLSGTPGPPLINTMCKVHLELNAVLERSHFSSATSLRELSQWISLFHLLVERGEDVHRSISYSWEQSYLPCISVLELRQKARKVFDAAVRGLGLEQGPLYVPGGWPRPLVLEEYISRSQETVVRRDCGYIMYLVAKVICSEMLDQSSTMFKSQRGAMHDWLKGLKGLEPYFPQKLLCFLRNPDNFKLELSTAGFETAENMEQMLIYAILCMLEQSPVLDLQERTWLLEAVLDRLGEKYKRLRGLVNALKLETQHQVVAELKTSWDELLGQTSVEAREELRLVATSRIIESANFYEEVGGEAERAWRSVSTQLKKLSCLRLSLLQWQIEDAYFQSANNPSTGRVPDLCKKIFICLFPLLRRLQNEALLLQWSGSVEGSYLELINWHERLWKVMQSIDVEPELLQYHWNRVKVSMQRLCNEANVEHVHGDILHVSQVIDETLSVGKFSDLKPFLWKYGGHPAMPGSMEIFKCQQNLVAVCRSIWQGKKNRDEDTLSLVSDPEVWLLLLKGLSIISSMNNSREPLVSQEILKVASEMLGSNKKPEDFEPIPLHSSAKQRNDQITKGVTCACGCMALCPFPKDLLRWPSAQIIWSQTHSWLNHLVLMLNGDLLAKIVSSVAAFTYNEDHEQLLKDTSEQKSEFQHVLSFSMVASSQSPAAFAGHQQVLWILDADMLHSPHGADTLRNVIHDITFQWHAAIWEGPKENLMQGVSACRLFYSVETFYMSEIIGRPVKVRDYHAKAEQLRTFLAQAWFSGRQKTGDALKMDIIRASASLQLIVYAHKSLFPEAESIYTAFSFLHSQLLEGTVEASGGHLKNLHCWLQQSRRPEIAGTIRDLLLPCCQVLYLTPWDRMDHNGAVASLGRIWLLIGKARMELLLLGYGTDPMAKYIYKRMHLVQKLEDISVEIQVRRESCELAKGGGIPAGVTSLLAKREALTEELHSLDQKLVPRPSPPQFRSFCQVTVDFMESVGSSARLDALVRALTDDPNEPSKIMEEIATWQENATAFIDRLSSWFEFYRDLAQPLQLAVYELKYGLSLVVGGYTGSAAYAKSSDLPSVTARSLCSLMQYPTNTSIDMSDLATQTMETVVEKVLSLRPSYADSKVLELKTKVSVLRTALMRVTNALLHSKTRSLANVKLLHAILDSFVNIWKQTRAMRLAKAEHESQQIRFKSHEISMEGEDDESSFKQLFPSYWSLESSDGTCVDNLEELVSREEPASEQPLDVSESTLLLIEEDISDGVVDMYKRLFETNAKAVDTKYWLAAFTRGYDTGTSLIEGTNSWLPKEILDAQVFLGHLLRLGVEQLSLTTSKELNIYKDANPLELSKMLDPLAALMKRVHLLLEEWPEHAVLLQLMQFAQSLVSIPLQSPIMKALTGLELLLAKAQVWEQNAAKHVALKDELTSISQLVLRWRRQELQSWPLLLQNVEQQHERNAEKLWFPFFDLLHSGQTLELDTIIESAEELLLSSPLGEFHTRLKLIWRCFCDLYTNAKHSPSYASLSSVLYNVYQYYLRCLPIIQDAFTSGKAPIEKELAEFVRLSKWEDYNFYSLVSSTEKSHRKLHKLTRKFDEHLKSLSMVILKKMNDEQRPHNVSEDISVAETTMQTMHNGDKWSDFCNIGPNLHSSDTAFGKKLSNTADVLADLLTSHVFSKDTCDMRHEGTASLSSFAASVIARATELRNDGKSLSLKKKALIDLRRGLKELGLSHRKAVIPQNMRSTKSWFKEPVSDLNELTACFESKPGKQEELTHLLLESGVHKWERAKGYYFDNISLLQKLYTSMLNYNKDLTLTEVEKFTRYMEHLLCAQQNQRRKISEFSSNLIKVSVLNENLKSLGCVVPPQQTYLRKLIWQQKTVLDEISQVSAEVDLFLDTMEQTDVHSLRQNSSEIHPRLTLCFRKMQSCKERLDEVLVCHRYDGESPYPFFITDTMVGVTTKNFEEMKDVEACIGKILHEYHAADSAVFGLVKALHVLLQKGLELHEVSASRVDLVSAGSRDALVEQAIQAFEKILVEIRLAGQRVTSTSMHAVDASRTIHAFEALLGETLSAFRLDGIYNCLVHSLDHMVNLFYQGADEEAGKVCGGFLKSLTVLLDMLVAASMQVFLDYISMHKEVAKLGYVVSNILNHLYRDGFCKAPPEESDPDKSKLQEAQGTGMGEGDGTKDVSEQIEDENQLLGAQDDSTPPDADRDQADKGVEMEQDFDGNMFDISEDESDEEEANEDPDAENELESKMGNEGDNTNAEVVDEKLWDKEDDECLEQGAEKLEQGASVPDTGTDDLQLRGKDLEDQDDAVEECEKENPQNKQKPPSDDLEKTDEENEQDKANDSPMEDAFEEPSGLKPSHEPDDNKPMEDASIAEQEEQQEEQKVDEMETDEAAIPDELNVEDHMDEDESEDHEDGNQTVGQDVATSVEKDDKAEGEDEQSGNESKEHREIDNQESGGDIPETQETSGAPNRVPTTNSTGDQEHPGEEQADAEQQPLGHSSKEDSYAASASFPLEDPANTPKKLEPNPYRSLGDALEKWKEMARMVEDVQSPSDREADAPEDGEASDAYKYVSNGEQGTDQALGAATDEQMKESGKLDKLFEQESEDIAVPTSLAQELDRKQPEAAPVEDIDRKQQHDRTSLVEPNAIIPNPETLSPMDEDLRTEAERDDASLVSLKSYEINAAEAVKLREEIKAELDTIPRDLESARGVWQKYDKITSRLSQDLAEQLRLILEPTLAARFQGDYKSGKRLNMKKIIPFVASGFKSDKIWLRRTKPNKRRYQVVLAIDDSRSMSESHCGHVALEALITLCRAMTQLEVGEMAVVSFGKKGNIQLLHSFDQQFSSEAGVKMISQFSFMQDNTILDDPMVDLMQHLAQMLEAASFRAGHQDLEQLVLVVADGRFHEKENLRRCVRDALSRKQLLAYIVLDKPLEDVKTVTFPKGGGKPIINVRNYLDSFPFPYYILLKDIEQLPYTVADLLRQWFELMQR